MVVGSDIDNCISEDAFAKNPLKCKAYDFPPDQIQYFITGRGSKKREATIEWLNQQGFTNYILYTAETEKNSLQADTARRKANWINHLHIDRFYEDSKNIINYLRANTKAEIIRWRRGKQENY